MVEIAFHPYFQKLFSKIQDQTTKDRLLKLIAKLRDTPDIGKPMRHDRKGTRELYLPPFRLSYLYVKEDDTVLLLDLYHKDKQ